MKLYERLSPFERAFLTISVMLGVFMAILDTTIVDIVVPKMMAPLSTALYGVQWVITSYMTAAATAILLVEWIESKVGLKKVYMFGLFLFTLSSFFCGQAKFLEWMILWRTFQGVGEALIVVSAEALLFSAYPPEKRGLAMGIYGLGVSFAPALGPTLGGYITEHIDWRWIFYINIPVGVLSLTLSYFFLQDEKKPFPFRLNFVSYFFISVSTVSTLIVLSKGQQKGWYSSDFILYLTLIAIFSFLLFLLSELVSKNPLLDFSIFRIREFTVALLVYFLLLGFSMYQVFYLIPLYYEYLKGLTTFQAGIHILPLALAVGLSSPIAGLISDKKSAMLPLYIAVILYLFASLYLMPKFDYFTPAWSVSIKLTILGVGMGFFFAPITNLALKKLGDKTTLGVSLMHYARFVGGSFGTALATNDLNRFMWESFQRSSEIQNHWVVYSFIEEKGQILFYQLQQLYALSNSFQKAFFIAGLWGLLGSLPIIYMFFKKILKSW